MTTPPAVSSYTLNIHGRAVIVKNILYYFMGARGVSWGLIPLNKRRFYDMGELAFQIYLHVNVIKGLDIGTI
jgi:hypothetical protein